MKKSRFSEEQIAYALRQVESGTPVTDVCRHLGFAITLFVIREALEIFREAQG